MTEQIDLFSVAPSAPAAPPPKLVCRVADIRIELTGYGVIEGYAASPEHRPEGEPIRDQQDFDGWVDGIFYAVRGLMEEACGFMYHRRAPGDYGVTPCQVGDRSRGWHPTTGASLDPDEDE